MTRRAGPRPTYPDLYRLHVLYMQDADPYGGTHLGPGGENKRARQKICVRKIEDLKVRRSVVTLVCRTLHSSSVPPSSCPPPLHQVPLLKRWTLVDALTYTNHVATRLQTWKDVS